MVGARRSELMQKNLHSDQEFLEKLKREAKAVQGLEVERLIPSELSGLASLVAKHTWQVLLALAILSSVLWEIIVYGGF